MQAALCDTSELRQGIALLSEQKYSQALAHFDASLKATPNDEQGHFCRGVCFHYMNQYAHAAREYKWVCDRSKNPELVQRARKGWNSVAALAAVPTNETVTRKASITFSNNGTSNTSASNSSSGPGNNSAGNITSGVGRADTSGLQNNGSLFSPDTWGSTIRSTRTKPIDGLSAANSSLPARPVYPPIRYGASDSVASAFSGTPKIVDVYTNWCHFCKRFAPIFEDANNVYNGQIAFERVDAEASGSASFMEQYRHLVRGYPTLLFFDGNGNVVHVESGAPKTMEEFENDIGSVWPQFKR